MKAYLIDPVAKAVTEIEYSGDWQDICKTIGLRRFHLCSDQRR